MSKLDQIDKKILNRLQEDSRTTTKELSSEVGISTTPVYERVKRLEKDGYIKKYVALVDKDKVERELTVFCQVSLKSHLKKNIQQFQEHMLGLPEVMECYHMAGNFDYLIKVMVRNMKEYQKFVVEKLTTTDVIDHVQSLFVMGEVKQETKFPLK
ncbi:Lrp/AsnC family transcriptional regulator [Limibacter armeniacum]|uniref:Lrp/AsnC family transcriptional regulator n=1 Tax=Limibacter armeniacum TaxID=466084 RepID=UPI002FE60A81